MSDDLFQPTTLDVPGSELDATIAALEARGALVQRMDVVSVSGYRLCGLLELSSRKLLPMKNLGDFYKSLSIRDVQPS